MSKTIIICEYMSTGINYIDDVLVRGYEPVLLEASYSEYPYADEPKEKQVPWHWDRVAKQNPFFAQLWAPLHDADEDNIYGPEVFEGWER